VHTTAEAAIVGDGDQRLPVVVFDLGRVSGVAVTLDPPSMEENQSAMSSAFQLWV
jgi:hypothetical protein